MGGGGVEVYMSFLCFSIYCFCNLWCVVVVPAIFSLFLLLLRNKVPSCAVVVTGLDKRIGLLFGISGVLGGGDDDVPSYSVRV